MDKLTHKFQLALGEAQSLAVGRDNSAIEPSHVIKALLDQEGGSIRQLLTDLGVDLPEFRSNLGQALDQLPQIISGAADIRMSSALLRLLNKADKEAQNRKDQYISSELFLLAATEEDGTLKRILDKTSITPEKLRKAIDKLRGGKKVEDPNAEDLRKALQKFMKFFRIFNIDIHI